MKPPRGGRRAKRSNRRWSKEVVPTRPIVHWLERHEAERDEADEDIARRIEEDRHHG